MTPRCLALALALSAILSAACGGEPIAAPEPWAAPEPASRAATDAVVPSGRVAVAYAEEPGAWHPALTGETAAIDLAHLWGLPLYHVGPGGELRPALAASAATGQDPNGWYVDVALRPGSWSDGTPVGAADVVATVDALRAAPVTAVEFDVVVAAEVVDDATVRLRFVQPYGRWPYLLAGGRSVVPASALAREGLEAFRGAPTVTGGPFRVVGHEPGRAVDLVAHADSPLGAPGLAELRIDFVPEFETALGLLNRDEVQVALGYLALNPVERAEALAQISAAAPLGGTAVWMRWRADGRYGGPGDAVRRQLARDAIDVEPQVEGLLGGIADPARSVQPGGPGPWGRDAPLPQLGGLSPTLLLPRWQEAPAFTARSLQRDLATFGGGAELVRLEPDELATTSQGDAVLEVRRDLPWVSLAGAAPTATGALSAQLREADAAPTPRAAEVQLALQSLYDDASLLPLYRIGVAHAWRSDVEGLRPSSWPGLGFWNAASWRRSAVRGGT